MVKKIHRKIKEYADVGFGTKAANQGERFINRDGTFNVEKRGLPYWKRFSFYHAMLNIAWWKFVIIILIGYMMINALFALIYMAIGFENLAGTTATRLIDQFFEAFFFSAQTFTTVGYGRINPIGILANFIVVLELLLGLLSLALATGLFYGRFSRPNSKILFTERALMAPYQGITAFMFRIANALNNQLIEVEVQIVLSMIDRERENSTRKFYQLELERDKVNFLSLSWTIVHPINENSPIYGFTQEDLKEVDAEFMIMVKGFDDTYAQSIYARSSYKPSEIIWGARFKNSYERAKNGSTIIDLSKLGACERAELPTLNIQDEVEVSGLRPNE